MFPTIYIYYWHAFIHTVCIHWIYWPNRSDCQISPTFKVQFDSVLFWSKSQLELHHYLLDHIIYIYKKISTIVKRWMFVPKKYWNVGKCIQCTKISNRSKVERKSFTRRKKLEHILWISLNYLFIYHNVVSVKYISQLIRPITECMWWKCGFELFCVWCVCVNNI